MQSTPLRGVQYVRMSTEHQRYSIEFQTTVNAGYALDHNIQICGTYTDAGVSGLTLAKRPGLKALLADAMSGAAAFDIILVYDVSRWGRFQDPDQSAHYEFLCREAGVRVEYCAEQFDNDGSLASTIVKQIKRAMAAEYSRELSVKISSVQRGLAAQGYRMSGSAGFGLRRLMVDERGRPFGILEPGQRKGIQGYRTILVPGPADEVATVNRVFRMYTKQGLTMRSIVRRLNEEGVSAAAGKAWTTSALRNVLKNEKYVGNNVFGKTRKALATKQNIRLPPEDWSRCDGAFEAIVPKAIFNRAQVMSRDRVVVMNDEQMLRGLRALWKKQGFLSARLINEAPRLPCASIYQQRFGSVLRAYKLIGYDRDRALQLRCSNMSNKDMLTALAALSAKRGWLSATIINREPGLPSAATYAGRFGGLRAALELIGYHTLGSGHEHRRRDRILTDDELLDGLRRLLARDGRLTAKAIDAEPMIPCRLTFVRRFGYLSNAYRLVGYVPNAQFN